jgi:hypothetical protein
MCSWWNCHFTWYVHIIFNQNLSVYSQKSQNHGKRTGTFFQLISLFLDMKLSISCAYRFICRVAPIFLYKLYEEACNSVKISLVNVLETVVGQIEAARLSTKTMTHTDKDDFHLSSSEGLRV